MVDRTTRPIVPVEHANEREHRRLLAYRANASLPKDGTEAMAAPLYLAQYATADLPTASLWTGAIVYDTDTDTVKWSNGSSWFEFPTYQDSTWTPVLTFGGSSTGVTYSIQQGTYTRIGRVCVLGYQLNLTSNGSGTGAAVITGLPFTPHASDPDYAGSIDVNGGSAGVGEVHTLITTNTAQIQIFTTTAGNRVALTDTEIDDNTELRGSITYRIA